MPIINKSINKGAYNADVPVLAFRHNNWRVIIKNREINVKEIEKEEDAVELMNYLENLVEGKGIQHEQQ
jgi:hypothetical protein